jgi:hypothetical protein
MKKGTKVFIAGILVDAVVEAILDTKKEYQDDLKRIEERYRKIELLKRKGITGDVMYSALLDFRILSIKISKEDRLGWKLLTRKSQRENLERWDKEVWDMINSKEA